MKHSQGVGAVAAAEFTPPPHQKPTGQSTPPGAVPPSGQPKPAAVVQLPLHALVLSAAVAPNVPAGHAMGAMVPLPGQ